MCCKIISLMCHRLIGWLLMEVWHLMSHPEVWNHTSASKLINLQFIIPKFKPWRGRISTLLLSLISLYNIFTKITFQAYNLHTFVMIMQIKLFKNNFGIYFKKKLRFNLLKSYSSKYIFNLENTIDKLLTNNNFVSICHENRLFFRTIWRTILDVLVVFCIASWTIIENMKNGLKILHYA